MTLAISRAFRKPFWATPFATEGPRGIFSDGLWPELLREKDENLVPNVDFSEKDGNYFLSAELPGIKKDDITISIEEGYVTVTGKKETSREEEETSYYLKETKTGSFTRSFRLPGKVDQEKVDAVFKDGVLTVTMPKEKASETRKIDIQ